MALAASLASAATARAETPGRPPSANSRAAAVTSRRPGSLNSFEIKT